MRFLNFILPLAFDLVSLAEALSAPNAKNAILLSNVQSLTLNAGKKTSHRRVSAVPQLKCVGGNGKGRYEVDTMRCVNEGSSYSTADVEWSCTASLPPEFKLGSTDVICEGYRDSDDEWVLKGSCGVEYRLILTALGEKKFGKSGWSMSDSSSEPKADRVISTLFWLIFVGVVLFMIYSFFTQQQQGRRTGTAGGRRPGGGGGGGGGGGWWPGNDNDDPPPPYSPRQPPRKTYPLEQQGWRPGFWSGAGAGAAAGYAAGRYAGNSRNNTGSSWAAGGRGGGNRYDWDRGEGSSGGSSNLSSSRYSSTGFGSTSRR